MSVEIVGLKELRVKLQKNIRLEAAKTAVQKNGDSMNRRMKANTQTAFTKGYTTGQTTNSINTTLSDGGLTVTVEPRTEYAPYVEYGTRKMEAEPFVKPAFEVQKEYFKRDMEKLVR